MPLDYPVLLDLRERLCLVVGGGAVAERKVAGLLDAGAQVRIVSPQISTRIERWAASGAVSHRSGEYAEADLEGVYLAFAAAGPREVNAALARDARARKVLVSVADAPADGDFSLPAVVRRGDLCFAISTGGSHPMLAARLKDEIEKAFGAEYGPFVELLAAVRDTVKKWTGDLSLRRSAAAAVLNEERALREHLAAGRTSEALELAMSLARAAVPGPEDGKPPNG